MRIRIFLLLLLPVLLFAQFPKFPDHSIFPLFGQYSPLDGNTVLLLRADMGIVLVDDSVSTWTDQAGGEVFTALDGARPFYNTSYPRIEFDGVNDILSSPSPGNWMTLNSDEAFTMEIHYYVDDTGALLRMIAKNLTGSNTIIFYQSTSDQNIAYLRDAAVTGVQFANSSDVTPADGTTRTVSFTVSERGAGGTEYVYINGISKTVTTTANNNVTNIIFSDAVDIPFVQSNGLNYYIYAIRWSKIYRQPNEILDFHNWCKKTFGE